MRHVSLTEYEARAAPAVPVGAHAPEVTLATLLRDLSDWLTKLCRPHMVPSEHHEFARRVARGLAVVNAKEWERYHQDREQARARTMDRPVIVSTGRFGRFFKVHREN